MAALGAAPALPAPLDRAAPARPLPILMRAVWIQALRRREPWVLAILLGIYGAAALVLRIVGIDSPQVARFVAGLGLSLAVVLSAALTAVMGARALAEELELRTIYPILAKPVSRRQVLLGKALPTALLGAAALTAFTAATLAITPPLPDQHPAMLAQALLLQWAALAMLTALVMALALWAPVGVALLGAGAVYCFGAWAANALAARGGALGRWAAGLIPDFALLDHMQRFVDGGAPLGAGAMAALLAYALLWTALLGGAAAARFERMRL